MARRRMGHLMQEEYRRGALLSVLLLLAACSPPDSPPRLPASLPPAAEAFLGPGSHRVLSSGPGMAFHGLISPEGPWAVHLLRVDLTRCELGLSVLKAPRQEGMAGGRERVSRLPAVRNGQVLAAVNGDFFTPEGLSVGTEVLKGEVSRLRNRPALGWKPGSAPWMGVPVREGDSVVALGWRISRKTPDGKTEVVGGFPILLAGGIREGDLRVSDLPSFAAARHPRTAVGYDPAQGVLWLVAVDGRQAGYSEGMTLPELASLLESLGATEAVNLDGGGSTVMVLGGVPVSRPSDAEGERPVANALAVVRDPGFCRAAPRVP